MATQLNSRVVEQPRLRDQIRVFRDREEAGRALAAMLEAYRGSNALVLGIPAGGVSIGAEIARELGLALDIVVASKITPPWNSEYGYGAVAFDGVAHLNREVLPGLGLSDRDIEEGTQRARAKVERRLRDLRGDRPLPDFAGRTVILADDGLATGVTMQAAVLALREHHPRELIVAVPTGHFESVQMIAGLVDRLYCPNVRRGYTYAVAEAYHYWHDMTDDEVRAELERFREAPGPARAAA